MEKEVWDAYDISGNKLGFDLFRGESIPDNVYHMVVEIYVFTKDNKVLTTQRHPDKSYPLKWENTGGSVLKGENIFQGAVRELYEETGIKVSEFDLKFVYTEARHPVIYNCFVTIIENENIEITLQDGETVDYKFLPYDEYIKFIRTDAFADNICKSFLEKEKLIIAARDTLKTKLLY